MATYELWLTNDRGRRLMPLNNLRTWAASKVVNGVGAFVGQLRPPADLATLQNYHYIERNIRPDWMVQVWYKARGPSRLFATYFLRKWGWSQDEGGEEVFALRGYEPNHLLTRRVVADYAETADHSLFATEYADDIMKTLVTDAIADATAPRLTVTAGTRAWGDLSVAADLSAGPQISIAVAFQRLLTLSGGGALASIAKAASKAGTEMYFRIAPHTLSSDAVTWQFRTQTGQPMTNRTSGALQVLFDADAGTLTDWSLTYDYSEEENYIYALGQGDESNRNVQQRYDAARYKASYWNRCEATAEARQAERDAAVQAAGDAALEEGRPRIQLTGTPVSRPGQEFLRHWGWGDKVVAAAKGKRFDAIVWSVTVGQDEDGKVEETARLKFDE